MKHFSFGTIFTLAILVILVTVGYFFVIGRINAPSCGRGITGCANLIHKNNTQMVNPASVNCEQKGGRVDIRTGADGGQVGYCVFSDGSECEEWNFLRGECTLTPPTNGWQTYNNDKYGYQISYPIGTLVKEAPKDSFSLSPQEVSNGVTTYEYHKKYSGKLCVSLTYKLGYIMITAPFNKSFDYVMCGRTGVAYDIKYYNEPMVINGKTYTVKVMVEKGPGETLQYHNETAVVVLDGGTRVEYGSHIDENATYADYLKFKPELIKIIESFKATS